MGGYSKKTIPITLRLPNATVEVLQRRSGHNNLKLRKYLQNRIIYDTHRKHTKGMEIPTK